MAERFKLCADFRSSGEKEANIVRGVAKLHRAKRPLIPVCECEAFAKTNAEQFED